MITYDTLIKAGIDNKVAELFPDLIIRKGTEFITMKDLHCRILRVSKMKTKVFLYDLEKKFAFSMDYQDLRKMLSDPKKARIL